MWITMVYIVHVLYSLPLSVLRDWCNLLDLPSSLRIMKGAKHLLVRTYSPVPKCSPPWGEQSYWVQLMTFGPSYWLQIRWVKNLYGYGSGYTVVSWSYSLSLLDHRGWWRVPSNYCHYTQDETSEPIRQHHCLWVYRVPSVNTPTLE